MEHTAAEVVPGALLRIHFYEDAIEALQELSAKGLPALPIVVNRG